MTDGENGIVVEANNDCSSETIVYDIGKEAEYENLRDWFMALYQILLGQEQGPRFGSFVALYGIDKTCELINKAINKELA